MSVSVRAERALYGSRGGLYWSGVTASLHGYIAYSIERVRFLEVVRSELHGPHKLTCDALARYIKTRETSRLRLGPLRLER